MQAVRAMFGAVFLTTLHLTQSTWRKLQELGLAVAYKTDDAFRHFCGMLNGLAFLPVQKLESLPYIFVADSMGLSSFKFVQWAPKDASFLHQSAFWPLKVIQGR